MGIDGILEKITRQGNEKVASGLTNAIGFFDDMATIDGGEYWNAFIKGYSRCLLNLGFINNDDVNDVNRYLFDRYVDKMRLKQIEPLKGGDSTE